MLFIGANRFYNCASCVALCKWWSVPASKGGLSAGGTGTQWDSSKHHTHPTPIFEAKSQPSSKSRRTLILCATPNSSAPCTAYDDPYNVPGQDHTACASLIAAVGHLRACWASIPSNGYVYDPSTRCFVVFPGCWSGQGERLELFCQIAVPTFIEPYDVRDNKNLQGALQ